MASTSDREVKKSTLLTRLIPGTQESLPVIGLGSWQTFDLAGDAAARVAPRAVLEAFAQSGGRLVDSSPMHVSAEAVIGECLGTLDTLGKFFIAAKVWTTGRIAGIRQMEDSLIKLRTYRPDLIQVHNLLDVDTHLETLDEWKWEGRVRYIGITHCMAGAHAAVEKVLRSRHVDFVQINYSLAEREAESTLLPLAADRGVGVIVNRPFAEGALLRRLSMRALPAWAADFGCDSWAQLALKFVISHPAVTCAIPATSNPAHLRDFMRAGSGPMPDVSARERIAAAAR
jgi:aryl-alcohol dehydrogenase-like predicted oxidoreductase